MSKLWEELRHILCCPDDRKQLCFSGSEYSCQACGGRFPILLGRIADLRPRSPQPIEGDANLQFSRDYEDAFRRSCGSHNEARAWGAPEEMPRRWVRKRERQVRYTESILRTVNGNVLRTFCDFSAGAGYYTLGLARSFPLVLHCDLSCDSLFYASRKADKLGLDNVAFLRIDYLQPPFVGQLDCAICMDSLERGEGHERMLLGAIRRSLRPGGVGVVDFHNWWHNPLRRLGILRQNFGRNCSYTRRQAEGLLLLSGLRNFMYFPFLQEFEPGALVGRMAGFLMPPTRHLFLFEQTD